MAYSLSGRERPLALVENVDADRSKLVLPHSALPPTLIALKAFDAEKLQSDYTSLHVYLSPTGKLNWKVLSAAAKATKPGSFVHVSVELANGDDRAKVEKSLMRTFTYAGLQHARAADSTSSNSAIVQVSGQYPSWAGAGGSALQSTSIDENELIAKENDVFMNVGKGVDDCSNKPKACANCSCGRKELEEKVGFEEAKRRLEEQKVESSCGSCGLGDAFRCDGCPYKGLPAFRPGEKVKLDMNNEGVSGSKFDGMEATVGKDGKVILS